MHQALLVFYVLFFAAIFVWPTVRVWRRHGVNPLVLPNDDTAHGFIGLWFKAVLVGLFGALAALAAGLPEHLIGPLTWLQAAEARAAGWVLMVASLAWIVVAQRQMGLSWRIGIDTREQPPLVRTGVFARSRNPIFLGMRVNLLGLFLVLPNGMTLVALALGEILMQVQARLEEAHLEQTLSDSYREYRAAVPRWL